MKSKSPFPMTVLGSFLVLLAFPTTLSAVNVSSCNYVISAPGTYTLTTNLLSCTPYGVYIQPATLVGNVTLNLNGWTISGAPGSSTGVFSGENSTIKIEGYGPASASHIGTITGFITGVESSNEVLIVEHVHITNNGNGIAIQCCEPGFTLAYNTISGNYGIGININGGSDISPDKIIGNTISGNGTGIFFQAPMAAIIRKNTVVNNGPGLFADGPMDGLLIAENEFSYNIGDGINLSGYGAVKIKGNAVSANTGAGILLDLDSTRTPTRSEIRSNTAGDNGMYGIALQFEGFGNGNNSICNNITIGNGTDDLFWDPTGDLGGNIWVANQFDTSNVALPSGSCS